MRQKLPLPAILLAAATALAAWFALISETCFAISTAADYHRTPLQALGRFWSYGTMLTNLLVAVSVTLILVIPNSAAGKFFSKPVIATAVAVYILLVFFGFNIFLRQLSDPKGWRRLDSELLHVIVPVLYFLYWIFFVPKTSLQWKHALPWLGGAAFYFIYVLIRGAIDGFYPYPFLDVNEKGYSRVLLFAAGSGIGIIVLGLLLIAIARQQRKKV